METKAGANPLEQKKRTRYSFKIRTLFSSKFRTGFLYVLVKHVPYVLQVAQRVLKAQKVS